MKHLKQLHLFVLIILLSYACTVPRHSRDNWELVFEHDQQGKPISGSIEKLAEAVRNGKEVRVMAYNKELEYIANAEHLWIKNGIVYMQNSSHISVIFQGDQLLFQDNAYHWYFIMNTNGERIMSRWLIGEHTPKGNNSDKTAAKWFVK
ncbi:MAG: hypothetical protein ACK4ND_00120 [Cytophagaceae bacterium]